MLALSFLSYFVILALVVALVYNDLLYYLLPNRLNAALALAFMAFHISMGWSLIDPKEALLGAACGFFFLFLFRQAANSFYKKDSLGLGDVKLMTAAGLGLGFPNILLAISLGALVGLFHGLLMARKSGKSPAEINVPAGLGLGAGIVIVMIAQFGFFWTRVP